MSLSLSPQLVFSNLSETMALLRSSPSLHLPLLTITEHNLPHSLQLLSLHSVVRCVLEGGAGSSQGGPQQEERDDSEREFPCDGPPRVHRRSNSWSGVSQELMVTHPTSLLLLQTPDIVAVPERRWGGGAVSLWKPHPLHSFSLSRNFT